MNVWRLLYCLFFHQLQWSPEMKDFNLLVIKLGIILLAYLVIMTITQMVYNYRLEKRFYQKVDWVWLVCLLVSARMDQLTEWYCFTIPIVIFKLGLETYLCLKKERRRNYG